MSDVEKEKNMAANENGSYMGKVVFVTGAGGGIGRATALAFAREGASVVVSDISEQNVRDTTRRIEELGARTRRRVRRDAERGREGGPGRDHRNLRTS
jgi:NAD(P)-dependent dehydrogenase (short-subunit alcohol dehydrogenase family)